MVSQISLESRLALNKVFEKNISSDKSFSNIASNTVQIRIGKDTSSGLMLTTDGFVLTAYHCIDSIENTDSKSFSDVKSSITTLDGNIYPIYNNFVVYDKENDIALIKAIMPNKPEAINYDLPANGLAVNQEITSLGYWNCILVDYTGKIRSLNHSTSVLLGSNETLLKNTLLTDAEITSGCSGGSFVTSKGEYAGLIMFGGGYSLGDYFPFSGGHNFKQVKSFVKKCAYKLNLISVFQD